MAQARSTKFVRARTDRPQLEGVDRLARWMQERGLTQSELARRMSVHPATISRVLALRRAPTLRLAVLIKNATEGYVQPEHFVEEVV